MKIDIIFFDCDGVLVFGNPWVKLHREMNISYELDRRWFDEYYSGKISFEEWNEKIETQYKREKLTRQLFEEILDLKNFTLNDEAWNLINFIKAKDIPTAIISNSIDYYVERVAKRFDFDYWNANAHLEFDQKDNFKKFIISDKDRDGKVNAINKIAELAKVDPHNSIYIGDSANDLMAFKYTKKRNSL